MSFAQVEVIQHFYSDRSSIEKKVILIFFFFIEDSFSLSSTLLKKHSNEYNSSLGAMLISLK